MHTLRAKCVKNKWNEAGKDPELTRGKFYKVTNANVPIMNDDSAMSLIGDNGEEITRPKYLFKIFKR
jgi:hypothetical protein